MATTKHLNRLWAPWRNAFLSNPSPSQRCFLCTAWRSSADRQHLVVARRTDTFVILNRYPYNNGHVLVAPSRHIGQFSRLQPDEWLHMFDLAQSMIRRLEQSLKAQGFNIGMNLGRIAGAGIPGHLHLHIVPRWKGDTNFFPIISHTKVISQSLQELYTLLKSS